jgi:hypothetical protein
MLENTDPLWWDLGKDRTQEQDNHYCIFCESKEGALTETERRLRLEIIKPNQVYVNQWHTYDYTFMQSTIKDITIWSYRLLMRYGGDIFYRIPGDSRPLLEQLPFSLHGPKPPEKERLFLISGELLNTDRTDLSPRYYQLCGEAGVTEIPWKDYAIRQCQELLGLREDYFRFLDLAREHERIGLANKSPYDLLMAASYHLKAVHILHSVTEFDNCSIFDNIHFENAPQLKRFHEHYIHHLTHACECLFQLIKLVDTPEKYEQLSHYQWAKAWLQLKYTHDYLAELGTDTLINRARYRHIGYFLEDQQEVVQLAERYVKHIEQPSRFSRGLAILSTLLHRFIPHRTPAAPVASTVNSNPQPTLFYHTLSTAQTTTCDSLQHS